MQLNVIIVFLASILEFHFICSGIAYFTRNLIDASLKPRVDIKHDRKILGTGQTLFTRDFSESNSAVTLYVLSAV